MELPMRQHTQPSEPGWLVLIGINKYHESQFYPCLDGCVRDAIGLYALLTHPRYGNFEPAHVCLLLTGDASLVRETAQEVVQELESAYSIATPSDFVDTVVSKRKIPEHEVILKAIADAARSASSPDLLLVYFAGHSTVVGSTTCLVPPEACYSKFHSTTIPLSQVTTALRISQARHKLLLLDACYGSPATDDVAVLASCQPWEQSYEQNNAMDQPAYSRFTMSLLQGLSDQALAPQGYVTLGALSAYVENRVKTFVAAPHRNQPFQTPSLNDGGKQHAHCMVLSGDRTSAPRCRPEEPEPPHGSHHSWSRRMFCGGMGTALLIAVSSGSGTVLSSLVSKPDSSHAMINGLAEQYWGAQSTGRWKEAATHAGDIVRLVAPSPKEMAQWLNNRACSLVKLGDYPTAQQVLTQVCDRYLAALSEHERVVAAANLGWARYHLGMTAEAWQLKRLLEDGLTLSTHRREMAAGWDQLWSRRPTQETAGVVPPYGVLARLYASQDNWRDAFHLLELEVQREGPRVLGARLMLGFLAHAVHRAREIPSILRDLGGQLGLASPLSRPHMEGALLFLEWALRDSRRAIGPDDHLFVQQAESPLAAYYAYATLADCKNFFPVQNSWSRWAGREYAARFVSAYMSGGKAQLAPVQELNSLIRGRANGRGVDHTLTRKC